MRSPGLLEVVRKQRAWLAVGVLLGLLLAVAHLVTTPRSYEATAGAYFSLEYGDSASDLVQGSTYAQNQVSSFALLVTTPAVLEPVAVEFGLTESSQAFARRVSASAPLDSVVVEVTVTDGSPEQSARLADAVVESLSDLVEDLAPANSDGDPTVRATTVAPAEVPQAAASPDVLLTLALSLLGGLAAGAAAGFLRAALDTRIRDAGVLAEVTDRAVVGTIGLIPGRGRRPVIVESDPHSTHAESYRQLRTNLEFVALAAETGRAAGRGTVLLVTSSRPGEGKSTVAANLAAALAETSASVLLVDADLRRPSVAAQLGIEGGAGLTTVLLGQATLEDVVQPWGRAGLQVLASGTVPPNPVELLGSPAMARLVDGLREQYDYVVVDTSPVLPVADAAVLSRLVDGALMVVNAGLTRRDHLQESLANLDQVGATVLGVVLNAVRRDEEEYSYRPVDRPEPDAAADVPGTPPVQPSLPAARTAPVLSQPPARRR